MYYKPAWLLLSLCLAFTVVNAQAQPGGGAKRILQRLAYVNAHSALASGNSAEFQQLLPQLADYPLLPYLEYAELSPALSTLPFAHVDAFLERHAGTVLGDSLQRQWLTELASANRSTDLIRYFNTGNSTAELTCQVLKARLDAGDMSALDQVPRLWNVTVSQPNVCDPVFAAWMQAGGLTAELGWQRFSNVLKAGQLNLARFIATQLPAREQSLAQTYLDVYQNPSHLSRIDDFKAEDPESAEIILHGLQRLASSGNASTALELLQAFTPLHTFTESARQSTEQHIALRLLIQGQIDTVEKLLRDNSELRSESLGGWMLRYALRQQDWPRVNSWLDLLPPDSRNSDRWRYWQARSLQQQATPQAIAEAQDIFRELAGLRSFYGFQSADELDLPYSFVDRPVQVGEAELQQLAEVPALDRALELFLLDDTSNALREWDFAIARLNASQVLAAGKLAANWGWHRNSIQAMIRAGYWDDLQLRFPLVYQEHIADATTQYPVLNTHFVFAVARQESAFMSEVISSAGAMGLMQLMPATAMETARSVGITINNQDLLEPEINIKLGSNYLAKMMQDFDSNRIVAAAAYNAGPNRVRQWLGQSGNTLPFDIWIETLPFAETRGYVQNVLAFAVIYAYLNGEQIPLVSDTEANRLL